MSHLGKRCGVRTNLLMRGTLRVSKFVPTGDSEVMDGSAIRKLELVTPRGRELRRCVYRFGSLVAMWGFRTSAITRLGLSRREVAIVPECCLPITTRAEVLSECRQQHQGFKKDLNRSKPRELKLELH